MNPRYVKELRLLVLPAVVAAVAVLSCWLPFLQIGGSQPGTFVFPVCVALLAALPFGAEFQHRTLPLLLVQPVERSRLWWEKMAVLGGVVALLGLLVWQVQGLANEFSHFHRGMLNLFLFAGMCSAGFWVQKTRSTAAAFLVAMAIQLVLFTGASWFFRLRLGPEPYPWDAHQARLLLSVAIIYSGSFLWLGWSYWKRRLWTLAGLGLAVLLFHWTTDFFLRNAYLVHGGGPNLADLGIGALFLLATVCSTAFWTLAARSTIGGAVFNAAGQFLGVLVFSLVLPTLHLSLDLDGPYAAGVILVGGLAYSLLFLWLGWRTFARLELQGVIVGEGGDLSQQVGWRWPGMAWLKCGPRGGLINLVRKELILQRPTFLIAAVLVACCLVAFAVQLLAPAQRVVCQGLVSALAFISVPLILLLAGSVSLGEEKSLGISGWHLTLPVKAWRQWWVKVAVSVVTGLCLGVLLPGLLIAVTAGFEHSEPIRILHLDSAEMVLIFLGAASVVVMSCWAAALLGNVVRATIGGMIALGALAGCSALSFWGTRQLGGLETGLTSELWQRSSVPLGVSQPFDLVAAGGAAAVMLAMVWQGFLLFRFAQPARAPVWVRYFSILVCLVVLGSAWFADLTLSADEESDSRGRSESVEAIEKLVDYSLVDSRLLQLTPGRWHLVTLGELQNAAPVSARAIAWLGDSRIAVMVAAQGRPGTPKMCQATITSPKGRTESFAFQLCSVRTGRQVWP